MMTHKMSEMSMSTRISDAGFVSDAARASMERDELHHASKAMPEARSLELEMGIQSQGPPMPRPESRAGPPMPRPESAMGMVTVEHTPVAFPSPEDFQSGSTISESAPDKVAQILDDDSPVHSSAQAMMGQVTPENSARRDLMAAEESAVSSPAGGSYGGGSYGGGTYGGGGKEDLMVRLPGSLS